MKNQETIDFLNPAQILSTQSMYFSNDALRLWRLATDVYDGNRQDPTETVKSQALSVQPTIYEVFTKIPRSVEARKPSSLQQLSKRLQDCAVFIAQQNAFSDQKFNSLIEAVYSIGKKLSIDGHDSDARQIDSRLSIEKLPITPPEGSEIKDYESKLFLFLLGKHNPALTFEDFGPNPPNPQESFYDLAYQRWSQITKDSNNKPDSQSAFDEYLLKRKQLLLTIIAKQLSSSESSRELSKKAVIRAIDQQVNQTLTDEMLVAADKGVEDTLKVTSRVSDFGEDVQALFISGVQEKLLFDEAKNVLEKKQEEYSSKGETLSLAERIRVLWDLVQAYPFSETFTPKNALDQNAMECNLRSRILGKLYDRFLGNDAYTLADCEQNHMRLIVVERDSGKNTRPNAYFVDPSMPRYIYSYRGRGKNEEFAIQKIEDEKAVDSIDNAYHKDPEEINLQITLSTKQPYIGRYHSVGNYNTLTEAALWNNIGVNFAFFRNERRACFLRAVTLNPTYALAWNNIGHMASSSVAEQRYSLNKSFILSPDNINSLYELGMTYVFKTCSEGERQEAIQIWTHLLTLCTTTYVQHELASEYTRIAQRELRSLKHKKS